MATGDQNDIVQRLKMALPPSWFANGDTPILNILLNGLAAPLAWGYALYAYTVLQMRLGSATGIWIDRISYDFLGFRLPRRKQELDDPYRARVKAEIMRPRQTRAAIKLAVKDLTGVEPLFFEPWSPADCGGYGKGRIGYGVAGAYGTLLLNNQFFVVAQRPPGVGVPKVGGYGSASGYGVAGQYISLKQITGPILDSDIYQTISRTKAAGQTAWVRIVSKLPGAPVIHRADSTTLTADTTKITADEN